MSDLNQMIIKMKKDARNKRTQLDKHNERKLHIKPKKLKKTVVEPDDKYGVL